MYQPPNGMECDDVKEWEVGHHQIWEEWWVAHPQLVWEQGGNEEKKEIEKSRNEIKTPLFFFQKKKKMCLIKKINQKIDFSLAS